MGRGGDGVLFVAPAGEAVPRSWLKCPTNHQHTILASSAPMPQVGE